MQPFPLLHTQSLDLIEIQPSHQHDLFHLLTHPQVTEFFLTVPLKEPEDTQRVVTMLRQRYLDGTGIRWGIALKGQPSLIGIIGFHSFTKEHRGTLVYALNPQYWGKGLITGAIAAVIQYGFRELELNRIDAEVMPGNTASGRALKKNGFQEEGLLREWIHWNGKFYDVHMYALLRSAFKTPA